MTTFTVHLRRTWDERYNIRVEAVSVEEALQKANCDDDSRAFDWNNVEASEREVMFIDEQQTGEQVYSLDEVVAGDLPTQGRRYCIGIACGIYT